MKKYIVTRSGKHTSPFVELKFADSFNALVLHLLENYSGAYDSFNIVENGIFFNKIAGMNEEDLIDAIQLKHYNPDVVYTIHELTDVDTLKTIIGD